MVIWIGIQPESPELIPLTELLEFELLEDKLAQAEFQTFRNQIHSTILQEAEAIGEEWSEGYFWNPINRFFHRFFRTFDIPWNKTNAFGKFFVSLPLSGQFHALIAQRIVMKHPEMFPTYQSQYPYKKMHFLEFITCFFVLSKYVSRFLRQNVIILQYSRFTFKQVKGFHLGCKRRWWQRYNRFFTKSQEFSHLFNSNTFSSLIEDIFHEDILPLICTYTQVSENYFRFFETLLLFLSDPVIFLEDPQLLPAFNESWEANGCKPLCEKLKPKSFPSFSNKISPHPTELKAYETPIQLQRRKSSQTTCTKIMTDRKTFTKRYKKSFLQFLHYCFLKSSTNSHFSSPFSSSIRSTWCSSYLDKTCQLIQILLRKDPKIFNGYSIQFLTLAFYLLKGPYPISFPILQSYANNTAKSPRSLTEVSFLKQIYQFLKIIQPHFARFNLHDHWSQIITYVFPNPRHLKHFVRSVLMRSQLKSYLPIHVDPIIPYIPIWILDRAYFRCVPNRVFYRELENFTHIQRICDECGGNLRMNYRSYEWICRDCGLVVDKVFSSPYQGFERKTAEIHITTTRRHQNHQSHNSTEFQRSCRQLKKKGLIDEHCTLRQSKRFRNALLDMLKSWSTLQQPFETNPLYMDIMNNISRIKRKNSMFFRAKSIEFNIAALYLISAVHLDFYPISAPSFIKYLTNTICDRMPQKQKSKKCGYEKSFSRTKYLNALAVSNSLDSENFRSVSNFTRFFHFFDRILSEKMLTGFQIRPLMTSVLRFLYPKEDMLKRLVREILVQKRKELYWLLELPPIQMKIIPWVKDREYFGKVAPNIYVHEFLGRIPEQLRKLRILTKNRDNLPILQNLFRLYFLSDISRESTHFSDIQHNLEFLAHIHCFLRIIGTPESARSLYLSFQKPFELFFPLNRAIRKIYAVQRTPSFQRKFKMIIYRMLNTDG